MTAQTLYEAAGGAAGLLRLAEAWHRRVVEDPVVSHAFSHGFSPDHTRRLAAYWTEALGGPATYSATLGSETSVVRMHSGNGVHDEMDANAIACFDGAMDDVGIVDPLRGVLHDWFAWSTTVSMAAYPDDPGAVPRGLAIPRWTWGGLDAGSA
jgi:hemoglobin